MKKPSLRAVVASLLVANAVVFTACTKNPVDAVLEHVVNWEGYFMAADGLVVELKGADAHALKIGTTTIPFLDVNDKYMIGMARTGKQEGEFRGWVVTKSGYLDLATVQITGNTLTIKTDLANDQIASHSNWTTTSKPTSTIPGPTTPPTGNVTTLLSVSDLSGDEKSRRPYTITVPAGTTRLFVQTTEDAGGRNLGDLFVRHGTAPVVNNANEQYTWMADCKSVLPNRESDTCSIANPPAGTWHILLYGYHAYWGTTLKATITK